MDECLVYWYKCDKYVGLLRKEINTEDLARRITTGLTRKVRSEKK